MEGRFLTLSKRQLALVLTVNESGSSFRFALALYMRWKGSLQTRAFVIDFPHCSDSSKSFLSLNKTRSTLTN